MGKKIWLGNCKIEGNCKKTSHKLENTQTGKESWKEKRMNSVNPQPRGVSEREHYIVLSSVITYCVPVYYNTNLQRPMSRNYIKISLFPKNKLTIKQLPSI